MKVTFALLVDPYLHNSARRLAYEIHREHGVGFYGAQLPPHISLKQPFHVTDLRQMEAYFDDLAQRIEPFEVAVSELSCWVSDVMGSISFRVEETPALRRLHDQINAELNERFEHTEALFDGETYRFHLTIALGGDAPREVYRTFYDQIENKVLNHRFTAQEMVMFYYDDDRYSPGTFITYKIRPLGTHPIE